MQATSPPVLKRTAERLRSNRRITFPTVSMDDLPLRYADWRGGYASDDCIFIHLGIPAYRFIAYGDFHHIDTDDFENLDLTMIDRVAEISIRGFGLGGF